MNQRLLNERQYHDAEAAERAVTFAREPGRLRFADAEYLDHASWVRPAMNWLDDVAEKRVLDLGCGHGMAAVVLARRGAMVTACDLSPGYVAEARRRANANEAIIDFSVADGQSLPFADNMFEAIWGHAILHHLDVFTAAREIRRVLQPGGIAVFCEPWDGNPLVRWLRQWRRHTQDERALLPNDISILKREFDRVIVEKYQLGRYVVIKMQ
jgi:ubiquinone/menaquinone biosynthesis C-methylase UbiE